MHNYARYPSVGYYSFAIGRQFIDDFESVKSIWDTGLSWGYETSTKGGVTTNKAMSDSPTGNYLPNTENTLTLTVPFDLSAYLNAKMYFYRARQLGAGDTAYVEYRLGAADWVTAKKLYGGLTLVWAKDSIDLPGTSSSTTIRFRLKTDGTTERLGILVDDIDIVGGEPFVGVEENEPIAIPKTFALRQNYPNPFNPSTTIQYDLPTNKMVSLRVYDLLGREVVTLVEKRQEAGSYQVVFDAVNLPSGIYFYRLTAGDFVSSRKMLLIK